MNYVGIELMAADLRLRGCGLAYTRGSHRCHAADMPVTADVLHPLRDLSHVSLSAYRRGTFLASGEKSAGRTGILGTMRNVKEPYACKAKSVRSVRLRGATGLRPVAKCNSTPSTASTIVSQMIDHLAAITANPNIYDTLGLRALCAYLTLALLFFWHSVHFAPTIAWPCVALFLFGTSALHLALREPSALRALGSCQLLGAILTCHTHTTVIPNTGL
ncbi:hypothetical protein DFH28DRAFT_1141214 [Melampsora americana]|nr:hypothetical protein DFH28DRAFT_1141214 [Melampsora americana]